MRRETSGKTNKVAVAAVMAANKAQRIKLKTMAAMYAAFLIGGIHTETHKKTEP